MTDILQSHSLNKKKGQQIAKEERGTTTSKPLTRHYTAQGGNKNQLLRCFQDHGDYIALMIWSEYTEMLASTGFHDLHPGQREVECVKLFSSVMTRYIEEMEKK